MSRRKVLPRDLESIKILIFDDADLTPKRELRDRGAAITVAPTPIRALKAILEMKPDLVISAHRYPELIKYALRYYVIQAGAAPMVLENKLKEIIGTKSQSVRLGE